MDFHGLTISILASRSLWLEISGVGLQTDTQVGSTNYSSIVTNDSTLALLLPSHISFEQRGWIVQT